MHTWHWQTWNGLPYLTCSLLKDWQHGFFTQQFWSRSPSELVEVLVPEAEVYRVKQVHGNTVLSPSEIEQSTGEQVLGDPLFGEQVLGEQALGEQAIAPNSEQPIDNDENTRDRSRGSEVRFPDADGLFTEQADQAVWVCTADCTPVLIADEETGQVAAVHAGWRGTALGIVQKAVARMRSQGSQLHHLRIAMGPAIAGDVYQVSTTVAAQVGASVIGNIMDIPASASLNLELPQQTNSNDHSAAHLETILETLRQLPDSPILDDPQPGRARLDVRRVNVLQLQQIGIAPEQIAIAPYCTYQNPDLFFSYRRSKQKKVQWSGIVSKN